MTILALVVRVPTVWIRTRAEACRLLVVPVLRTATHTDDGFGDDGPGGTAVTINAEGFVVAKDGTF